MFVFVKNSMSDLLLAIVMRNSVTEIPKVNSAAAIVVGNTTLVYTIVKMIQVWGNDCTWYLQGSH